MAIYLDYNATSPLLTLALERLTESARLRPGNPSSAHWFGQEARNRLEECRRELAAWVGADSGGLVFTSGGSESNALALRGFAPGLLSGSSAPVHVIGSPMDHPSVVENLEWLERQGAELSWLPSGGDGTVEVEALPELLRPNTRLVAFAGANNETGVVQPIRRGVELIQQAGRGAGCPPDRRVWFYTDLAQAAGRMELAIKDWGVDGATLCAHKMGGPRGVGALWTARGFPLTPLILGGGQEKNLRAGTEPLALVEGWMGAVEWHQQQGVGGAGVALQPQGGGSYPRRLAALRDSLAACLAGEPGFFINGQGAGRLPNTLNCGFEGISAQSLITRLDLAGVAVSGGSACSSGASQPSPVLAAMGLSPARLEASFRISLGHGTTNEEIVQAGALLADQVRAIRKAAAGG